MKSKSSSAAAALLALVIAVNAHGQLMIWETSVGGNGNTYQVVKLGSSPDWDGSTHEWDAANALALAAGGHLATITSAAENGFITSLVGSDADTFTLDLWVGGFQPSGSAEPADGWSWVTGEPFTYSNWFGGGPNNNGLGGVPQDHLDIVRSNFFLNGDGVLWDDVDGGAGLQGYVVEFEATPVPEPSEYAAVAGLSLMAFGAWRRSRR